VTGDLDLLCLADQFFCPIVKADQFLQLTIFKFINNP
jgi:hypothetical protein